MVKMHTLSSSEVSKKERAKNKNTEAYRTSLLAHRNAGGLGTLESIYNCFIFNLKKLELERWLSG